MGGVESLRGAVTKAGSCQLGGGWEGAGRSCRGWKDSWPFRAPILGLPQSQGLHRGRIPREGDRNPK